MRPSTVVQGAPLLVYLLDTLGLKRKAAKNLLKFGAVVVNGVPIRQFDHRLLPGDRITFLELQAAAAIDGLRNAGVQLIYEDDALLVADKPSGLLTVATDDVKTETLYVRVNEFLSQRESHDTVRAVPVHRLDQGTSGLVLFSKSDEIKRVLQAAWPTVEKTYWAVVLGRPKLDQGTITSYLTEDKSFKVFSRDQPTPGAQRAVTHYRVLQSQANLSLVEIRLETGRKHQIRVHMAHLRCPVAGDERYGGKSDRCSRLALHAGELTITHPVTEQRLKFSSPLPAELGRLLNLP